jgi:hypothetical protein
MEKQEAKSKWDELVRQLGAEVSPEIEQRVEAGPAPPVEPVSISTRASREEGALQPPAAPKRPAAGWNDLAHEFGLPPAPEPEVPALEETVAVPKQVVPHAAGAERPQHERPGGDRRERYDKRRESRGESRQSREEGREPREEGREPREQSRGSREQSRGSRKENRDASHKQREPRDRRRPSSNFRERNEGREEDAAMSETSQPKRDAPRPERDAPQPTRQVREEPKPEPVEERPKPGPAVSLWHKIFGSPADQSAKLDEISTRPDDATTTGDADVEQSLFRDEPTERDRDVDERVEPRERDEFERGSDTELDSEQREEGQQRPRRSRRRRRGRGGKSESGSEAGHRTRRSRQRSDEPHDDGDDVADSADDEDELGFDDALEPSTGDAVDTDDVEGGENGNQRSARRAALQRSIPSWDEAIGFIVDANMQSRSQRRPAGPAGSRGGSPRGRSRGRRRS